MPRCRLDKGSTCVLLSYLPTYLILIEAGVNELLFAKYQVLAPYRHPFSPPFTAPIAELRITNYELRVTYYESRLTGDVIGMPSIQEAAELPPFQSISSKCEPALFLLLPILPFSFLFGHTSCRHSPFSNLQHASKLYV